jgi:hypothetical protein
VHTDSSEEPRAIIIARLDSLPWLIALRERPVSPLAGERFSRAAACVPYGQRTRALGADRLK